MSTYFALCALMHSDNSCAWCMVMSPLKRSLKSLRLEDAVQIKELLLLVEEVPKDIITKRYLFSHNHGCTWKVAIVGTHFSMKPWLWEVPGSFDSLLLCRMDGSHSGFRDRSKGSKNAVQLASLLGAFFGDPPGRRVAKGGYLWHDHVTRNGIIRWVINVFNFVVLLLHQSP